MLMDDEVSIDPWGSSQSTDYSRIIEKFGLSSMEEFLKFASSYTAEVLSLLTETLTWS